MLSLCSFYRKSVWSWRLEAHGVFCQQHNLIRNWNPLELGHQREFQSRSDPVHMDGRATRGWWVLKNYREISRQFQNQLRSSPLLRVYGIPFHSILMSLKKKNVFFTAPHLWRPFSQPVSHYYTHGLEASAAHTLLCSAADGLSSSYPCILSPPSL